MPLRIPTPRSLKAVLAILLGCLLFLGSAQAQDTVPYEQARKLAQKIEVRTTRQSQKIGNISPNETLTRIRMDIIKAFDLSNNLNSERLIAKHSKTLEALELQPYQRQGELALNALFSELQMVYDPNNPKNNYERAHAVLAPYTAHENWKVAYAGLSLQSYINVFNDKDRLALQKAAAAFEKIPDNTEFESEYARAYSYEAISYLHNLLGNFDLAMKSTDALLDYSKKTNFKIDGIELINNLIYSLGLSNETEISLVLVDTLLRLEAIETSDTPALAEMRAAIVYVRAGKFTRALALTQAGLPKAQNTMIKRNLTLVRIKALAGVGQLERARTERKQFLITYPEAMKSSFVQREVLRADALIARAAGDAVLSYTLMQRYHDRSVQRILTSSNNDTAALLASLENSKERQAERKAAREAEFKAKQDALKQRIKNTRLWLLIASLLAFATAALAAFLAYRVRVSRKLAISAQAALAGEIAKTQFLAVISHELRTPLNGIIGIADLLSRTAPTDDLRKKISIINDSGMDLLKLVEQILDMSRIEANEMEVYPEMSDIREVIDGIDMLWRPTIENKDITFTSHVDPSAKDYINVDPLRLRQCINNLISNASKFTKQGRIHMHVTTAPIDGGLDTELRVIVADTGIGIRQDVQDNLFKPFVQADSSITRQYGGSGLGLAITRSLARMMGGDLTLNSRVGAGTEFTLTVRCQAQQNSDILGEVDALFGPEQTTAPEITVPKITVPEISVPEITVPEIMVPEISVPKIAVPEITVPEVMASEETEIYSEMFGSETSDIVLPEPTLAPTAAIAEPAPTPNFETLSGLRVLIVEDVASNQDVMKIFLEPEGCSVVCTDDGQQALDALAAQVFDVVLMDIRMPEMDGIEATRLLRSRGGMNTHVPIIALTADATAETNAQCMAAGANIFLTKPVIAKELYDSIRFVRRQAHNREQEQALEQTQLAAPQAAVLTA